MSLTVRAKLKNAKRLVVKVGTTLITRLGGRDLDRLYLGDIARQVAYQRRSGREVILVTSGAIGAGVALLELPERPVTLPGRQAAAAVGQVELMHAYELAFRAEGLHTGQMLLTRDGLEDRLRYLNARNTLNGLLAWGVVPVINENDTVAVEEIHFGDNDMLSAMVASLADADALLILTDAEGLMTANPRLDQNARRLPEIEQITPQIEALAAGEGSLLGTGGMRTKLMAARLLTGAGVPVVIAPGRVPEVLRRVLEGEDVGTFFRPAEIALSARKRWIAYTLKPLGRVLLDAGAVQAVRKGGKSLLPAGIKKIEGEFQPGDALSLCDEEGGEFARGLSNYSSADLARIMGRRSPEIAPILGQEMFDEAVHRDNLVVL